MRKNNGHIYKMWPLLVRPEGFEPPIFKFVAWYSIQLNYGRIIWLIIQSPFLLYCVFKKYSRQKRKKIKKALQTTKNCAILYKYLLKRVIITGRSAVGSARGLGPWGRRFDSCRPDQFQAHRPFGLCVFLCSF